MAETMQPSGNLTQYTSYTVFRRPVSAPDIDDLAGATAAVEAAVAEVTANGVTVRGLYDVSGFRHDGDVLLWLHGDDPEALQAAIRRIRMTALFAQLETTWNVFGVHRAAEFNERHMPAFMYGKEPKKWISIYPFVRSYDWYLLDEADRSEMLRDHGMRGSKFKSVLANTVAAFAISDYEWMLAFESDELYEIVDMMRDLRYTEARRHVRHETPFYAGRRIAANELGAVLRHGAGA
ncbi:chlorite dismutase family protein [Gulosibacter sp. GYB002]|uniref:hydrogen peroxide-dependent heme synthase n=1 Tax=Gulosibacter sp. GYB002 TaxID=2994391 RepID=UPI002F9658FA